MNYIELYIPAPDVLQAEIFLAELAELPFESFQPEDTCLKAYIRKDDFEGCRVEIENMMRSFGVGCRLTEIEQQNWNSVWESNFEPVDVDGRCVIRAPFHDEPAEAEVDVIIMPKMSFGTGHHATTWLMASEIINRRWEGLRGLDMGSGTGVLAIIAAKRGATHVDAVDIDQWAYENCKENVCVNGVGDKVTPVQGAVSAIKGRKYDFILANINRNILLADMASYRDALVGGGLLIMSGIFETDIPVIHEKASSLCFETDGAETKDGWAAIAYIKK